MKKKLVVLAAGLMVSACASAPKSASHNASGFNNGSDNRMPASGTSYRPSICSYTDEQAYPSGEYVHGCTLTASEKNGHFAWNVLMSNGTKFQIEYIKNSDDVSGEKEVLIYGQKGLLKEITREHIFVVDDIGQFMMHWKDR